MSTKAIRYVVNSNGKEHRAGAAGRQGLIPILTLDIFPTYSLQQSLAYNLSNTWRPTFEIGAAQLRHVTEIAPKSPFLHVARSNIQYGFRAGEKAVRFI